MMPDFSNILLFLTATIILNLIPGADVLYIASQSIINRKQGTLAALGISTGIGVYIIATAFGLAGILQYSTFAFNCIKITGAIYLFYLAWKLFFRSRTENIYIEEKPLNSKHAYYKGILTTLLNPKVGLFFITFLPQFTDINRGNISLQLLMLGLIFVTSGTLVNFMYVFIFRYLKNFLFSKPKIQNWFDKVTAFLFFTIAIKVLTSRQ